MVDNVRKPSERSEILESTANVRTVEIISHGPIDGFPVGDPEEHIYINDVPIRSGASNYNYNDILIPALRTGEEGQQPISGFTDVVAPLRTVNVELIGGEINVTPAVHWTTSISSEVDAVIITIQIPRLVNIDQDNGEIRGNETALTIYAKKPSDSFFSNAIIKSNNESQGLIKGKILSSFFIDYRIEQPADNTESTWEIQVRKQRQDEVEAQGGKNNQIFVAYTQAVSTVTDDYAGYAVQALDIPSSSVAGSVSGVTYDVRGMLCRVPSAYNSSSNQDSTGWDGVTFTAPVYTNNPAWCILEYMRNGNRPEDDIDTVYLHNDDPLNGPRRTDTRKKKAWGMGIPDSEIDFYSFAEFAGYCDYNMEFFEQREAIVEYPDTYTDEQFMTESQVQEWGMSQRRWTMNMQITDQKNPQARLQSMLGIYRSFIAPVNGRYAVVTDKVKDVTTTMVNSATLDGFSYTFTDRSLRYNQISARFADAAQDYTERTLVIQDDAEIALNGLIATDIVLQGITNEFEARRVLEYTILSSLRSNRICTFKTGMQSNLFSVGDRIQVLDSDFGDALSGRIVEIISTTQFRMDRDVSAIWPLYGIVVENTNGYIHYLDTGGGTLGGVNNDIVTYDGYAPQHDTPPALGDVWYAADDTSRGDFQSDGLLGPQDYTVLSITESNEYGVYDVICKEYMSGTHNGGFDYLDSDANTYFTDIVTIESTLPKYNLATMAPPIFDPVEGFIPENVIDTTTNKNIENLRINWDSPQSTTSNIFVSEYNLKWRVDNGNWNYAQTKNTEWTIENAKRGEYDIRLTAKSIAGVDSPSVNYDGYEFNIGTLNSVNVLQRPEQLRTQSGAYAGTGDYEFISGNLTIRFNGPVENSTNIISPLKSYIVEFYAGDSSGLITTHIIDPADYVALAGSDFIYETTLTKAENESSYRGVGVKSNGIQRNVEVKIYTQATVGDKKGGDTGETVRTFSNDAPVATSFFSFNATSTQIIAQITPLYLTDLTGYIVVKTSATQPFSTGPERLASLEGGHATIIYNGDGTQATCPALGNTDYRLYVVAKDTMTDDIQHYMNYGNWAASTVVTTASISIDIEGFSNVSFDCRLDSTYSTVTGLWTKLDSAGFVTTSTYTNHKIGVNLATGTCTYDRPGGDHIIFENFPNHPNHDFAASNLTNPGVDTNSKWLYIFVTIPSNTDIDANRTLLDAGTQTYQYTGSAHRVIGSTSILDSIGERQVIVAQYDRFNDQFTNTNGNAVLSGDRLIAGSVGTNQLIAGGVHADRIVSGTLTSTQIQAGGITAGSLAVDSVVAANIAAGSIDASKIAANSITADEIDVSTLNVDAAQINSASITTLQVQGHAVTTQTNKRSFSSHFFKFNGSSTGSWLHRASSTDSTLANLIRGHNSGAGGSNIVTSDMADFPTLTVYLPSRNDVYDGNDANFEPRIDCFLTLNMLVGMKSRTNNNFMISSNFQLEMSYVSGAGGVRTYGSRVLPDWRVQTNMLDRCHSTVPYTTTMAYNIPVHPTPGSRQTVKFKLKPGTFDFYSPTIFDGAGRADVWKVLDYGFIQTPDMTCVTLLR